MDKAYFDYWNPANWERANLLIAGKEKWASLDEWDASTEDICKYIVNDAVRARIPNPEAAVALEIGSGPGRLVKAMRRIFGEVIGIDFTPGMIELGVEYLKGIRGASVVFCDGQSIPIPARSIDFVYAYICFQHIPYRTVIMNYLAETKRVLKLTGIARLQTCICSAEEFARLSVDGFKGNMEGYHYPSVGAFALECELQGLHVIERGVANYCKSHVWVTAIPNGG